jgi:hypothetical protein
MTPQEIQERNKQIALMLGGYKCSKISEQYELPKLMTFPPKGNSNLCHTAKVCMLEDMQFHADWNWLHEAAEFIRRLGWNYDISSPIASLKESSLFECDFWNKNNPNIKGRSLNSQKEAVFIAVSDFAKHWNSSQK